MVTAIWSARRKMFQTYHKEGSRIAQMEKVRHTRYALFNKVCTFKTCKKCQILTEAGGFGRKMEKMCSKILHLTDCCPQMTIRQTRF